MAASLMFKAEVKGLELSGDHVENSATSIDMRRDRNESTQDIQRRAFAKKILAIQKLEPTDTSEKATLPIRVAKVRVRCGRGRFRDFEKLELTEQEVEERRHALAQKLIAKTLRQADRRRPRRSWRLPKIRLKIYPLCFRRWNISLASFSPVLTCIRWLRQPWLRLARLANLAARKHCTSRVTCCPSDDHLVPLLSVSEFECQPMWISTDE